MKALDVAKYIINKGIEKEKPVSNLQLQKILYFSHIDTIKAGKGKLVDEKFEAWDYGPVCREVYNEFAPYGANKMTITKNVDEEPEQEICDIIDKTINKHIDKSPWELVAESHKEGSAWKETYVSGAKKIIDDKKIDKEAGVAK